ncbi:mechanosensitive ion channel family protein [Mastigocoleus sp. MO_188.B34]|uniref:mechanosensitive ion channel family protein n=1 Tax=Mastigocoleus sp. MO_188.B34 TaxID=3036635 RepID=UPI0026265055|nr:mechanosensitive ion channel family protein [Mastigocoleus sp. MO_188.B34]MDJ0697029.1 mechanosensitive ion channel family protein [Mastigocoleus sp. MO_188.B34]
MNLVETIKSSIKELISNAVLILPSLLTALIIIFLTRFVAQLVAGIATKLGEKAIRSKSLQILLSKTVYVATWTVGILLSAVIAFPGLSLGDIIATLGLSSVAIGFAFQDIFKNFLAGILLLLQEPFRIGDQIIIDNYEGTVERVDIRTTKIRTYTGERILLPNSTVFTSAVQVRTAFNSRRTDLAVGVDYNTPLPKATEILERAIAQIDGVLQDPAPEIDLVGFGDSSIDFLVRYWTLPQQVEVRRVKTQAIIGIKRVFDDADINIPYPIRTLYFYNQEKFNDYLITPNRDNVAQNSSFNSNYR